MQGLIESPFGIFATGEGGTLSSPLELDLLEPIAQSRCAILGVCNLVMKHLSI